MTEIGLFPLGIVLLPTELVPLHIFEERYQELIGECLDEDARVRDRCSPTTTACTRSARGRPWTEVLERFDDGRLNIVVEGRERFRVAELTGGRSFQTAEIEPVEDDDVSEVGDPADAERALALFEQLVELTGTEIEAPERTTPQLSYAVAARFDSCRLPEAGAARGALGARAAEAPLRALGRCCRDPRARARDRGAGGHERQGAAARADRRFTR